jgi:hypothetical protein
VVLGQCLRSEEGVVCCWLHVEDKKVPALVALAREGQEEGRSAPQETYTLT